MEDLRRTYWISVQIYSVQPQFSRRIFVGSIIGLAAIGGAGALALWWERQGNDQAAALDPPPAPTPKPIPTKGDALYIYRRHQDQVFTASWSPNDRYIASAGGNIHTRKGDNGVHVWEALTGQDVYPYLGHPLLVRMVAWSPNGKYIAAGYQNGQVKVWQYATGKQILTYIGHNAAVMSVQWSHNDKYIASCGFDKTVQTWTIS